MCLFNLDLYDGDIEYRNQRKSPMKLKLMPIIMGAITLTGSLGAIAFPLGATSFAANTQNTSSRQLVAQAQGQGQRQRKQDRFAALNLTQAQKDQIAQIRKESREQMKGIISQDQRDKYKAAIEAGKTRQEAKAAMNITDAQKAQMKSMKQATKAKIDALLTTEQRTQLQQMSSQWRQQRNTNQQ
jgi:Spy/CpxP family protein refolding chaperone